MLSQEKVRGPSLYKSHQTRSREDGKMEEEDDPSARPFDREKDVGGGRTDWLRSTARDARQSFDFWVKIFRGYILCDVCNTFLQPYELKKRNIERLAC